MIGPAAPLHPIVFAGLNRLISQMVHLSKLEQTCAKVVLVKRPNLADMLLPLKRAKYTMIAFLILQLLSVAILSFKFAS